MVPTTRIVDKLDFFSLQYFDIPIQNHSKYTIDIHNIIEKSEILRARKKLKVTFFRRYSEKQWQKEQL